jgi:DNA-binding NarL/FixJ family response regulator
MVAIAVYCPDPARCRELDELLRAIPEVTVVGLAAELSALIALIEESYVDLVVTDAPSAHLDWRGRRERTQCLALIDEADPESIEALRAGAAAILPRSAGREALAIAIKAVVSGLVVLPQALLKQFLAPTLIEQEEPAVAAVASSARLTPRELEVLAKMADGASNKAIARALDISFHTAKFHVAAILAKLDADSRTEAVTRAAQLGLVML